MKDRAAFHGQRDAATAFDRAEATKRQRMAERHVYRAWRMLTDNCRRAAELAQSQIQEAVTSNGYGAPAN